MSLVSNFANGAFSQAAATIGTTSVQIDGGSAVAGVKNEVKHAKGFDDGGFVPDRVVDLVVKTGTWTATYANAANSYVGNTATLEGMTWRVAGVEVGASTTTVRLEHEEGAL